MRPGYAPKRSTSCLAAEYGGLGSHARDVTVSGLHMRRELDKNRWERVIPLSARARAALKSLGTLEPAEPLFGEHDYRTVSGRAA